MTLWNKISEEIELNRFGGGTKIKNGPLGHFNEYIDYIVKGTALVLQ